LQAEGLFCFLYRENIKEEVKGMRIRIELSDELAWLAGLTPKARGKVGD